MPLNSTMQYVKGLLDGLVSPQAAPLEAVIADPVIGDIAQNPIAYLWNGTGTLKRQTMPRPVAWQKWSWTFAVALIAVMDVDDPTLETAFPLLIDQINALFSVTPIPVVIADPITGYQSQVLSFGEMSRTDYARSQATGQDGQSLVRFAADISVTLEEAVSFPLGSYYNLGTAS